MDSSVIFARFCEYAPHAGILCRTPQLACELYQFWPQLSHFEYINRWTCPDVIHPPSWIFKNSKFCLFLGFRGSKCVIIPNFMIRQAVAVLWWFNSFPKWLPSAVLNLKNYVFSCGCGSGICIIVQNIYHGGWSNSCWDMVIVFDFSKWRPSSILEFKNLKCY